jgi:hypothetical protein
VRKAFVNQSDRDASARDPWLVYRLAQFWQRDAIVERLREAVRR